MGKSIMISTRSLKVTLAMLALGFGVAGQAAAGPVLVSGVDVSADVQGYLTARGIASTYVDPANLATTSLAGYSAVWLGWATTYPGLGADRDNLLSFMQAGGNVLIEPETNWAELSFMSGVTSLGHDGNAVHITDPGNPAMGGLTDVGLSLWDSSYHDTFAADASWSVLAVGPDNGDEAVIIEKTFGLGHLILTGQDPDYHSVNGSGPTGASSPKIDFVVNALTYSNSVVVPEPSSLVLAGTAGLIGLGFARFGRRRKFVA